MAVHCVLEHCLMAGCISLAVHPYTLKASHSAYHLVLQACILRKCLKMGVFMPQPGDNLPELRIILHDTLLAAENLTPPFMRALARQGWQTEKIVVEAHRRRARW